MKRKRGHKKGKSKKLPLASETATSPNEEDEMSANSEGDSGSDEEINGTIKAEAEAEAGAEQVKPLKIKVETPPVKQEKIVNFRPDGVIEQPKAVYKRVKVKLKTLKPIPVVSQVASSSDGCVDKIGQQQVGVDKKVNGEKQPGGMIAEKVEESAPSMLENRKSGGIRIVTGKGVSPSSGKESSPGDEKKVEKKVEKQINGEKQPSGMIAEKVEESAPSMLENRKSGGIRIVTGKGVSPSSGKESSPGDEKKAEKKVEKQVNGEKQPSGMITENVEESAPSMLENRKSGGIRIVTGKGVSPSSGKESSPGDEKKVEKKVEKRVEKKVEEEVKEAVKVVEQRSRYNRKELEASMEVIKKVMKMDAAEPFNAPVNAIELGIPDYFDIIDTPMDFGTIRSNLESGIKFTDSEDVYKDVQYIWNNCFKYNNKSDYIVDLMKRVKKNFMKYWVAAGLYTEQTRKATGGENTPMDEATSGHGKKLKRGKGVKRHKDDCMCAICIMKRRRREREAREAHEAGGQSSSIQTEVIKSGLPTEYKQEENSLVESPFGEDTSSYMETSPDVDADAEMEDGEEARLEGVSSQYDDDQKVEDNRMELHDKSDRSDDVSEKSQRSDRVETESYSHPEGKIQDESGSGIKNYAQEQSSVQSEGQLAAHLQQRHVLLELEKKRQKLRLLETFRDLENPMLSGLCGTLFPSNPRSVWNGANSLVRSQKSQHRRNGIHETIALFMTPSCKSASSSLK